MDRIADESLDKVAELKESVRGWQEAEWQLEALSDLGDGQNPLLEMVVARESGPQRLVFDLEEMDPKRREVILELLIEHAQENYARGLASVVQSARELSEAQPKAKRRTQ